MKKIILMILFAFGFNTVNAQYILKTNEDIVWYEGLAQEKVVVSSNTSFFFTGESMFYKVYCFNAKTNNYSNNSCPNINSYGT